MWSILTSNLVLDLSIVAWFVAQVLKGCLTFLREGKLDLDAFLTGGGMPSSHSAIVCALATSIGFLHGISSPYFALAFVLAFIVMYDAANVRKASGEHAKILNYIVENWQELRPDFFGEQLKELLGHTPLQVFAGAVLGVAIGLVGCLALA